ncbi:MAG: ferritin-like domain-containing protein [Gemmatimonadales bacterium]|nr:ferritin-like domain-containing protein [Gemmatimonadales bacterium]
MNEDKKLIFEALEHPEVLERAVSRRDALRGGGKAGIGLALASMPIMLAALTRRAFAQGSLPNEIVNPLNFALVLEYLEDDFYRMGLETAGLIPSEDRAIFEQVGKHEAAHIAFLSSVLGSKAAIRPSWDFTAGGQFDPFGDYPTFMLLAQGFEDTGVRAYKGQAGNVASNDDILTAALRIHSVEARHASEIRRLRGEKGWITLNNGPAPLAAVYAGEQNTTQLGIDVAKYQGAEAGTEAFDEPLGLEDVLAIAGLFGTGT